MIRTSLGTLVVGLTVLTGACTGDTPDAARSASHATEAASGTPAAGQRTEGRVLRVADTAITVLVEAAGVAEPMQQATLSTKLMGTVSAVLVREGDRVRTGQVLVRVDARDLASKAEQVAAARADAEAMLTEATRHAERFASLYADSAATRAQYDAAMTGKARAEAGVRGARAAQTELDATQSYSTIRAPFAGVVSARFADPGTFAAPGVPLFTVQDVSMLRITANVGADAVRGLARGQTLGATIDGAPATARVEGIVSTSAGGLFTINATVPNRDGRFRAGSSAVLLIPTGRQQAVVVPQEAIVRDGDLTGVIVRGAMGDERRWVRLGVGLDSLTVVAAGLRAGEEIVVPSRGRAAKGGS